MSEAKQRCQLEGCTRAASTRCFCCNKSVCTRHFTEHIDAVRAQVDPLADAVNTMVEKIQALTIDQLTELPRAQLNQWKQDMYQLVDDTFLAKSQEMDTLIERNREKFVAHKKEQFDKIMKIQDDVKQLVEDGDATFEQVQLLKSQLAGVEANLASFQTDFISINARVFGHNLLTVSSNLNKPPIIPTQPNVQQTPVPSAFPCPPNRASGVCGVQQPQTASGFFGASTVPQPSSSAPIFGSLATNPPFGATTFSAFGGSAQMTAQAPTYSIAPTVPSPFSFGSPQSNFSQFTQNRKK